jgi:hypothetical protein
MLRPRILLASFLLAAGCSSAAHADRLAAPGAIGPRTALAIAPAKVRAPYDVQVIREGGDTLPTYALKDRYYVQGNAGERYIIRVTNPTGNRVEAVVTVDGLDVVDGEAGDLRKRGYVVPPYGEVRIEGFRTSTDDVATFRFSSVSDSYAGKKGKARNVGVIAVALFEEEAAQQQQIIVEPPPPPDPNYRQPYDYEDDLDVSARAPGGHAGRGGVATVDRSPPRKAAKDFGRAEAKRMEPAADRPATTSVGGATGAAPAPRMSMDEAEESVAQRTYEAPRSRPGLGTEFGESRYSAASFTRFVRAANRPIAIAELRYNDTAGLFALGIHVQPLPDEGELMTRETADPFPGDGRFATPPR